MTQQYRASFHVPADHPSFAGHFPGQPLLPGVLLLSETIEAALGVPALRAALGDAPRLANAKFLAPVRPGQDVEIRWDHAGARLAFELHSAGRIVAAGQFESVAPSANSPGSAGAPAGDNRP